MDPSSWRVEFNSHGYSALYTQSWSFWKQLEPNLKSQWPCNKIYNDLDTYSIVKYFKLLQLSFIK